MCTRDITKDPYNMEILQQEVPVLFDLFRTTNRIHKIIVPVLKEILKKAKAPFEQAMRHDHVQHECMVS